MPPGTHDRPVGRCAARTATGPLTPSEVASLLKDANLYNHMREVALANGFASISEAIAVAKNARRVGQGTLPKMGVSAPLGHPQKGHPQ